MPGDEEAAKNKQKKRKGINDNAIRGNYKVSDL